MELNEEESPTPLLNKEEHFNDIYLLSGSVPRSKNGVKVIVFSTSESRI